MSYSIGELLELCRSKAVTSANSEFYEEVARYLKDLSNVRDFISVTGRMSDRNRARELRMLYDFPRLADFYSDHALPTKVGPKCFTCGAFAIPWPPALQHPKLPNVIVCHTCIDAIQAAKGKQKE